MNKNTLPETLQPAALILSDLHLGPGRDPHTGLYSPLEDFLADDAFAALLDHYSPPRPPADSPTRSIADSLTLVLAGDTFNLSETEEPPTAGFTATATQQLHRIAAGHTTFFAALSRWLERGNEIFVIPGNHDWELRLPPVQDTLYDLICSPRAGSLRFGNFYHNPQLHLYVEHGDQYCLPRKPGHPPAGYWRDRYFTPIVKQRIPQISNIYHSHYLSQLLAADPFAFLPILPRIPAYLLDRKPAIPWHGTAEHVTLHTINIALITANWDRAQTLARRGTTCAIASLLLRVAAALGPAAALVAFLNAAILPGVGLALFTTLLNALSRAAAHAAENTFATDLPRAAARDIAPAVARAGVRTLVFGHSHHPDHARFGQIEYLNAGTWIHIVDPLAHVPAPTQTYILVDDRGRARLLQWTERGPREPIIVGSNQ